MANSNAYQVKLRVRNTDSSVKMTPPFIEGVVFAKTPASAEENAIKKMTEHFVGAGRTDVTFEKFKVKKIPSHFVFS